MVLCSVRRFVWDQSWSGEVETAFYANKNESNLHVDDERMSDFQQNVLFTFNMLCLLLLYNINN